MVNVEMCVCVCYVEDTYNEFGKCKGVWYGDGLKGLYFSCGNIKIGFRV